MIRVAIDARLLGAHSTGDSTHWAGILGGFVELRQRDQLPIEPLFISNAERPENIPWHPEFEWAVVPGSGRWWSLVSFPLAARRMGCNITHVQYNLSPLARNGITTVHDVSFFIGPEWFSPRDRFLLQRGVSSSCRRAKRVVTVSETSKGEIEDFIPGARGKTEVVLNACPQWIRPNHPELMEQHLASLGLARPFCLTVGTRWPRKNMELAVQAMDLLPDELPHRLVVTGKAGWGDQALGKRGVATGYVSEEVLCSLYSAADLYLAPSRHEGFGLPLLEAMRCGCPVLCSAGGAMPEVAGDAALVEPSWEASDWTATIRRLLQDSGTLIGMRERGFRRVEDFSWRASAARLVEIYREVAE